MSQDRKNPETTDPSLATSASTTAAPMAPPPAVSSMPKPTFQLFKQSSEYLRINKLLNGIKDKFKQIKNNPFITEQELTSAVEAIRNENSEISELINKLSKDNEKTSLTKTQANIVAEIDSSLEGIKKRAGVTIPTQIQLSTVDFTKMQTTTDQAQMAAAVKLTRENIMEVSQQCFNELPKDNREIIVMDFDGTLNIEQGSQRGLFGGKSTQQFIKDHPERFYILTGGAGEDPSRAYDNLSPAMSHIEIDVKNDHIVSTGAAMTGLKGNFLARRLYANNQLGNDANSLTVSFLDDGINNHTPFVKGFMEELLKLANENGDKFVMPSSIEFNCIWVKRPDDNPHAGTDNSHGDVGRLRTLFGAPNPKDMEEEGITQVNKGNIISGSHYGAGNSDFRVAIQEFENQIQSAPSSSSRLAAR